MPATAAAQGELLSYNPECPDWIAVKILLDEIEEEITAGRSHLLYRVNAWLVAVRVFKRVEERKIVLNDPTTRDIEFHRAFTSLLLGHGDFLLMELRRHKEIDPEAIGIRFEDVAAHVEELRYESVSRYGDMTDQRRAEILREVFGAQG